MRKRILVDMDGVLADILIDDHLKNLENFPGNTYMYTQPLNLPVNNSRHIRVNSWDEIEKILL